MSEDRPQNKKIDKTKHQPWLLWIALLIVFIVAITCCFIWQRHLWNLGSIDEQFAAIDAELAIPDAENAAVFYRRFFRNPKNQNTLDDLNSHTPSAYVEPWADSEHPELAAKLKKHRMFMQTLLDISQMQKARFPVYPDSNSGPFMLPDMRKLTFILSWAAANDLAEGRIDAAYSKYRCQLKLARHLHQQPAAYYRYVGIAIEAVALGNIRRAVMRDDITPEQLRSIENILETPLTWDEGDTEIAARVDRLIEVKEISQQPLKIRLKVLWLSLRMKKQDEKKRHQIRRLLSSRHASRILIAIRRHKQQTGVWPESLEQLEPKLPGQILTDPQNDGPFAYKRHGDSFVFYSMGPNNINEGGSSSGSADDWPIWPRKIIE